MEERTYHGYWWKPSEPEERYPGVLAIGSDGALSLELIGGFDLTNRTPLEGGGWAVGFSDQELPLVCGESEGTAITLLNCHNLQSRGGWFVPGYGPTFQRLYAQRALIGAHLEDQAVEIFRRATARFENLTAWLGRPAMARTLGFENDVAKAELRSLPQTKVVVDGWTYQVGESLRGFNFETYRERHVVSGDATSELTIIPPTPAGISAFDRVTTEFMDLLTLATGEACGLISLILDLPDDLVIELAEGAQRREPKQAELIGRRVHTASPDAPAVRPHDLLFSCNDMPFEEAVPAWLGVRRRAASPCNVFFGMKYARPGFTETRLLLAAVTVESLDQALTGQRRSFRQRAKRLATIPSATIVGKIIPDIDSWSAQLAKARNGLAHDAAVGVSAGLFGLEMRTTALISLVFMTQIGISEEVQRRAAETVLRVDVD